MLRDWKQTSGVSGRNSTIETCRVHYTTYCTWCTECILSYKINEVSLVNIISINIRKRSQSHVWCVKETRSQPWNQNIHHWQTSRFKLFHFNLLLCTKFVIFLLNVCFLLVFIFIIVNIFIIIKLWNFCIDVVDVWFIYIIGSFRKNKSTPMKQ